MPDFLLGLDLGQSSDPTALSILKRSLSLDPDGFPARNHRGDLVHQYACVHLERYVLGTSYPAIVAAVHGVLKRSPLNQLRPVLAIDATGVGRAVVDLFLNEVMLAQIVPITITAGDALRRSRWNRSTAIGYWVPKNELVSAVQAGLQSTRLKISPRLALADTARKELSDFRVTVTKSANETFSARSGAHDDLVLSIAMPLWLGGRREIEFVDHAVIDDGRDAGALVAESKRETAAIQAETERDQRLRDEQWHRFDNPAFWDMPL